MNLSQMYAACNAKSGYARQDAEIYAALNRGGFRVYAAVLKEFRGFFIKFDESSLSLDPNNATQEYAMPADLTQIVHMAERLTSTENWRPMPPTDLSDALTSVQDSIGWDYWGGNYGPTSPYSFYGPYLDAAASVQGQALQIQKVRIDPKPEATRFVQIAYTAKWLPIQNDSSSIMLPDEGTMAMENFASAELCAMSDDMTRAAQFEARGVNDLNAFLYWARARQIMQPLQIETYGPGE